VTFVAPNVQEKRLANGVRVLVVERHELPVVVLELAFDRGADQDKPGVGSFVGAMLLQGTKTRSALQLADDFERVGAAHSTSVHYDAIARQTDRPETILGNTVAEVLYPVGHPYASSLLGTAEGVKRLEASDLQRFHGEAFRPDRLTVAVSGDVRFADVVAHVETAFDTWKGSAPKLKVPATPAPPKKEDPRVILVDRPGAVAPDPTSTSATAQARSRPAGPSCGRAPGRR
jgi:zinc protease